MMTSWYSNLVTKTSSQISSLRATLLASEADGDTDDDTHVCRVLRNYYADKGRPLPPWLPPDPKAPAQPVAQPLYSQQSSVGSRYGLGALGGSQSQQQLGTSSSGLSSLWGDSGGGAQQQQQQPQSLRAGSRTPVSGGGMLSPGIQARPLPSQRAGSYQNALPSPGLPPQGSGGSAQDRLRQRLWGGSSRGASPANSAPSAYQAPAPAANSPWSGGGGDDYAGSNGSSGRWGGGGSVGAGGPPGAGGGGPRLGLPSGPRRPGAPSAARSFGR